MGFFTNFFQILSSCYYLGIGIACFVVYYQNVDAIEFHSDPVNLALNATETCGIHGVPPLPTWVLGTAYGYTIIGACNTFLAILLILTIVNQKNCPIVLAFALFSGLFAFIWQIMGSVTLFRDNMGCQNLIYPIWAVSMAAVISMFGFWVISCCFGQQIKKERD